MNWNDSEKTVNKCNAKHMVNVLNSDIRSTKKVHWKRATGTLLDWKRRKAFF